MRLPAGVGARIAFVIACAALPALVAWLIGQTLCTPSEAAAPIDAADTSGARGGWEPVAAAMLFGGLGWLAGWITVLHHARDTRPPHGTDRLFSSFHFFSAFPEPKGLSS